jgi:beta-lactam-binding protein with PASTA domain
MMMVLLYVVLGLAAVLLIVQQIVELRRRSVRKSVERYHRAMSALGEMSDHVKVVDVHAASDGGALVVLRDDQPVIHQAAPAVRPFVRPAAVMFPTPSSHPMLSNAATTTNLIEERTLEGGDPPSGVRNRGHAYAIVLLAILVLVGTVVVVLSTSSSPPKHPIAKGPHKQRHPARVVSTTEAIPQVVALTTAEAEARLVAAGLRWRVIKISSANAAAIGKVVEEHPAFPGEVARDQTVILTVAVPVSAKVPNVLQPRESAQAAKGALRKSGFAVKEIPVKASTASELALQGQVLSEAPAPGAVAAKGSSVTIRVITGTAIVAVPGSVVGESPAQAGAALAKAQLVVGSTTKSAFSPTVPAGYVAGTFPVSPGQSAPIGSTINLAISTGPAAVVPNLEGDTVAQARHQLRAAGLVLGQVRSAPGTPGLVVAQAARPGRELRQRTPIAVVVGASLGASSTLPTSTP